MSALFCSFSKKEKRKKIKGLIRTTGKTTRLWSLIRLAGKRVIQTGAGKKRSGGGSDVKANIGLNR